MPHRSLCSISGRSPRIIPQPTDDAIAEKTESVCSDDPAPPSSDVFFPAIPKFSLERSFPSILSTAKLMRAAGSPGDRDSIVSLSRVFLTCLRTIVRSMDDLPHDVRLKPAYEIAQCDVIFAGNLFENEVSKGTRESSPRPFNIDMTLELADLAVANLRSFLKVAERVLAENKPLPALPASISADAPTEHINHVSLITVVDQVLDATESISDASSALSASVDSSQASTLERKRKKKYSSGSIIRRIVGRRSTCSKTSFETKSSMTLVDHEGAPKESFKAVIEDRATEQPYLPRQSAFYYLADPYSPEIDVDMPIPTGDTVAIRLDHQGEMKAASLTALVRLLTSKDSVLDQELMPTFFICFRFFTTPTKFAEELIKRYNEKPPDDLNPAQLRIWTRQAMGIRLRVGKAILMWLDLYWRPDSDSEVIQTLQTFALDHLVRELPEGLSTQILECLDAVWVDEPICPRTRKANDLKFIYSRSASTPLAPTGFEIAFDPNMNHTCQLLTFNTSKGREEFARQLTIQLAMKFQLVDPEDTIKFWHTNEESETGRALRDIIRFERALCSWVTSTVLELGSPAERSRLLEFWLDVSARCMRLRDFSGAHSILGGISNSAISRMKHSILLVGVSNKQQFRTLQAFLGGQDNFADYREALTSVEPTVPMLPPLIRDVTSALAVVPTSVGTTEASQDKNLINLRPYRVVTKTVRALESCLIPYKISKNDGFDAWLEKTLARFPSHLDVQINNSFYTNSTKLEAKEPLLSHVTEPWSYTIEGSIPSNFTLHPVPVGTAKPQTRSKWGITAFLKRP